MLKQILTFFLFFTSQFYFAQTNLVPNPSFETYTSCPTGQNQVSNAVGWNIWRTEAVYFNACATQLSTVSVPKNDGGYQYAAGGNGYMGLYSYKPSSAYDRGSIGCKLTTTLSIGTKYFVSFKANLSDIDSNLWYNTATDHLGALFSTIPHSQSAPTPTTNFAHVYSTTIITDTLNWIKIKGSFVADSAYQYIAIGNFFDNLVTNKYFFFNQPNHAAFYFIDDICVSTDSNYCANWTYTGINEMQNNVSVSIYPNPFSDFLTVNLSKMNEETLSISIYDISGQKLRTYEDVTSEKIIIKKEDLTPGVYILKISDKKGNVPTNKKIIIQ